MACCAWRRADSFSAPMRHRFTSRVGREAFAIRFAAAKQMDVTSE
jgi:hypothetical protein